MVLAAADSKVFRPVFEVEIGDAEKEGGPRSLGDAGLVDRSDSRADARSAGEVDHSDSFTPPGRRNVRFTVIMLLKWN